MKVAVTGSHGLIGTALVRALRQAGHTVVPLVRGSAGTGEVQWDPAGGVLDLNLLEGIEGAVHLAGEGIADKRWTDEQKQRIRESRVKSTDLLARTLAQLHPKPQVLVSGSAIGFYGDRGDDELTEESSAGAGFLPGLVTKWELATAPAEQAGIRVAHIRSGIVLSAEGGALKKQLPLFKLGVGGRLGSGRQYQSWISIADEVGAILHVLGSDALWGPVNLTAPQPVTNASFTRTLASVLGRPAVIPVPTFALSLVFGAELVAEALLASQRVLPARLQASGYSFEHSGLAEALCSLLGKPGKRGN
jgi:uncharacterized protein (TIGR01777 family)